MKYVESKCCICFNDNVKYGYNCEHQCLCKHCYVKTYECPMCRCKIENPLYLHKNFVTQIIEYRLFLSIIAILISFNFVYILSELQYLIFYNGMVTCIFSILYSDNIFIGADYIRIGTEFATLGVNEENYVGMLCMNMIFMNILYVPGNILCYFHYESDYIYVYIMLYKIYISQLYFLLVLLLLLFVDGS